MLAVHRHPRELEMLVQRGKGWCDVERAPGPQMACAEWGIAERCGGGTDTGTSDGHSGTEESRHKHPGVTGGQAVAQPAQGAGKRQRDD